MTVEPTLVLDVLGRRCPAPIIELAKHLRDVEIGQTIGVLADDPAAALDIPAWCEMREQEYLGRPGEAYLVRRLS